MQYNFFIEYSDEGLYFVLANSDNKSEVLLRNYKYFKLKEDCKRTINRTIIRAQISGSYSKRMPQGNNWNFFILDDDESMTKLASGKSSGYSSELTMENEMILIQKIIPNSGIIDQTYTYID